MDTIIYINVLKSVGYFLIGCLIGLIIAIFQIISSDFGKDEKITLIKKLIMSIIQCTVVLTFLLLVVSVLLSLMVKLFVLFY